MIFRKKETGCNLKSNQATEVKEKGIYVLGSGCKKCNKLEENVKCSLEKLAIDEPVFHITDFGIIASLGVMSTPALVIDKKIVSYGKVLSKEECYEILMKVRV